MILGYLSEPPCTARQWRFLHELDRDFRYRRALCGRLEGNRMNDNEDASYLVIFAGIVVGLVIVGVMALLGPFVSSLIL